MKIGLFTSRFPYAEKKERPDYPIGGSVSATYSLACEMAKKGHEICVFTSSDDHNNSVETSTNMTVYRYGTFTNIFSSNISPDLFYKPFKYPVDLVHISFDIPPSPVAGFFYAKKMSIPLITTYHADMLPYGNPLRKAAISFFNKLFVNRILSTSEIIISPSKRYMRSSNFLKKFAEKTVVIPNGIDLKKFRTTLSKNESRYQLGLDIDKKIILFCGFLSPHKGPDIALEAFSEVFSQNHNAELIFLGDGLMKETLIAMGKKHHLQNNIRFVGFIEDIPTKLNYFNSADIFVLPSLSESFGMVNLEAMACGLPIVASDIGGIPDLIENGKNGLLVPPNEPHRFASAIIFLLQNQYIMKEMGHHGKRKVEEYSWENVASKTEKYYQELIP